MSPLSLREAAQQVGVSKSTLLRAIHAGRLTAPLAEDGGYVVDPAELQRVYPAVPKVPKLAAEPAPTADSAAADVELLIRNAQLEAELGAMKALLEAERRRGEELREERDRWFRQAERAPLPAPVPVSRPVATTPSPIDVMGRLFRRSA